MTLYKYATTCAEIAEELKDELSNDECEDVFDEISNFSISEWYSWREQHAASIRLLATAVPAKRKKLLSGAKGKNKLRLVFGAVQYCLEASEILSALENNCSSGLSYRNMIGAAHDALAQINAQDLSFWPWSGLPSYRDFPTEDESLKVDAEE